MDQSDSLSVHSAQTTPKSLTPSGKKVGFAKARPTLIIPPPQNRKYPPQQFTSVSGISGPTPNAYQRKQSAFYFDQFQNLKGFTKSGLGLGEKCAFWLFHKVRSWSRKWFTHMFLTVVLILYTVGGALVFEFVEGKWCGIFETIFMRLFEKICNV